LQEEKSLLKANVIKSLFPSVTNVSLLPNVLSLSKLVLVRKLDIIFCRTGHKTSIAVTEIPKITN